MPFNSQQPKQHTAHQRLLSQALARTGLSLPTPDALLRPMLKSQGPDLTGGAPRFDSAAPHRTYHLGLRDLAAGRGLKKASLTGWRYLLFIKEDCVAAGYVADEKQGNRTGSAMLNFGPYVAETKEKILFAETLPSVRRYRYELALVSVPGLCITALWLRGQSRSAPDVVIPLAPAPAYLAARRYPPRQFCALLRTRAVERLEQEAQLQARSPLGSRS